MPLKRPSTSSKRPLAERWICKDPKTKIVRVAIIDIWSELEAEGRSFEVHQDKSTKPPDGLHPLIQNIWHPWARTVYGVELFDQLAWNQGLAQRESAKRKTQPFWVVPYAGLD